jgi:hypothetical protein
MSKLDSSIKEIEAIAAATDNLIIKNKAIELVVTLKLAKSILSDAELDEIADRPDIQDAIAVIKDLYFKMCGN